MLSAAESVSQNLRVMSHFSARSCKGQLELDGDQKTNVPWNTWAMTRKKIFFKLSRKIGRNETKSSVSELKTNRTERQRSYFSSFSLSLSRTNQPPSFFLSRPPRQWTSRSTRTHTHSHSHTRTLAHSQLTVCTNGAQFSLKGESYWPNKTSSHLESLRIIKINAEQASI